MQVHKIPRRIFPGDWSDHIRMNHFGCQSMAGRLRRVLMRRPGQSLLDADPAQWHYNSHFDAPKAIRQYREFVEIVQSSGTEISWIDDRDDGLVDSIFTRDASLVTAAGAVMLRMGKPLRTLEPELHQRAYQRLQIPILGGLTGAALMEGGDTIWLNATTLAVGLGFRSNREGVEQLGELLDPYDIEVLGFDLPVWQGEDSCLHLMSVISPLAEKLFLVHKPLVPAALWRLLQELSIETIVAPVDEFEASLGLNLNVLPLAPRDCVMIDGFAKTRAVMEAHDVVVRTFAGEALCMACEGGPTCLSNPIQRDPQPDL